MAFDSCEANFYASDRYWPDVILLHVDVQVSKRSLLMLLPSLHCVSGLVVKYQEAVGIPCLGLLFCMLVYIYVFVL